MVGNRDFEGTARLTLLAALGLGACSSVLGIEDLHSGPRDGAGAGNNGGGQSNPTGGNGNTSAAGSDANAGSGNKAGSNNPDNPGGDGNVGTGGGSGGGGANNGGSGGTQMGMPGTVHGKIIDMWNHALGNVPVQIGTATTSTDAQGEFTIEDVPAQYDVSFDVTIPNPSGLYGWVYQGLTRRDPTLQVYVGRVKRESNDVPATTKNAPSPKTAADQAMIAFGMPEGERSWTIDTDSAPGRQLSVNWFGDATTTATGHALFWTLNAADQAPSKYKSYTSKLLQLSTGSNDQIVFDLTPTTIPDGVISGTITPAGTGARYNRLYARFETNASIRLMAQSDASNTFSYTVPTLPKAGVMLAAFEGDPSDAYKPLAVAHQDGVTGGDSNIKLAIPAPAVGLKPSGAQPDALGAQTFSFTPGSGNKGPYVAKIEREDRSYFAMYVVTASQSFKMPEVLGGSFNLDHDEGTEPKYSWSVQTQGSFADVDAMAGPTGFIDAFGAEHSDPSGPRQQSGSFTRSQRSFFTVK